MGKNFRSGRIGEEIKKIISNMLIRELKDPRLLSGLVSITTVEVTNDHTYATIYLSVISNNSTEVENEKQKADVITAFNSAKGFIKRELGQELDLRHVPELIFKIDTSLEYGRHIEELISKLNN
ncbi:MAG: 30S ribosome-binding factor RbfA [Eubacteriales bacterium]